MLLTADIGNTGIKLGIFEESKLIEILRIPSDKTMLQKDYEKLISKTLFNYSITSCIISSVVKELSFVIKNSVDNIYNINSILLTDDLNLGINLKLKNPKEVGADRIANACAIYKNYSTPAIAVDLGTATTFEVVDKKGDFLGGTIMLGIENQFKSLNTCTSKLPKINPHKSETPIGNCTENAILSGVIRGSACAIDGLINQIEKELGEKVTVIGTGGYASTISKYMTRKFDHVNSNLTLEGLKYLYELNKQKDEK